MTIAVCLKVQDGVVMASDSAVSLANPEGVANVYNHGNKMANLIKGWPLGAASWGAGSIGNVSMSTLMKDLRVRLTGERIFVELARSEDGTEEDAADGGDAQPDPLDWFRPLRTTLIPGFHEREKYPEYALNVDSYTVQEVAEKLRRFLEDEHYAPLLKGYQEWLETQDLNPEERERVSPNPLLSALGVFVAGYSAGATHAEVYQLGVTGAGDWYGPTEIFDAGRFGVTFEGQPEWIKRLVFGFSDQVLVSLMEDFGIAEDQLEQARDVLISRAEVNLWHPAMPVQDAIDFAAFLVDLTKNVSRFAPGAPTVGGATEVAAITKHEGFKWVSRKHYYSGEFNPPI